MSTTEHDLIERYIDLDTDLYPRGLAGARLREFGVPVWALIGHLRVSDGNLDQVATDYVLPREAVQAAVSFYKQHRGLIDARLLLNRS